MPAATSTASEADADADAGPWRQEATDLVRAVSGGMLFGIPLLYTMEVWWIGSETQTPRMVGVLLFMFVPVFLLTRTAGFRTTKDIRWRDAVIDSVETVAIAVVSVFLLLVLLREITMATPLEEALGKIVYEATPFAIGSAIAQHVLRRGRAEGDDDSGGNDTADDEGLHATVVDVGATTIGAVFVAFNVAPTDEIPMLAAAMPAAWLIAMMGASLVISYCIVFVAGFSDQKRRHSQPGILQHPITETVASYLISLVVAGGMLWFFQRLATENPTSVTLSHVIVLGLPAAVGGAAGRLAA
ncbi:MAG TPA: TIGR02587 family membrane protein [Acidimicrobiales bacterium]|nr:TIGR02587 family membrane protein [Acidimicrobiales bacterium]